MGFVGRDRELGRLASGLERAARREPSRFCLVGPAGIGVSRLLDELERRLADVDDVIVVRGAAYAPLSGMPYAPLGAALERALATVPDARLAAVVGPAAHELAPLLPELAGRLEQLGVVAAEAPFAASADQRSSRFAEAVIGLLERLAGSGAVLLALEDLHWADPGTHRFVDTLLRISRRLPLCLVLAYQPDELHLRHPMRPLAQAIEGDRRLERLALPPLERHEIVRLLEGLLGERPSGSFVAAVFEGSGGNPLLAEQLVAAQRAGRGIRLSDPLEEIVRSRLEPLTVGAVRCLRLLAAARRPLPASLVRRVGLPAGRLPLSAIDEALESGLAQAFGPDAIGIPHERHAEAIEALGLPADRQPIHAALARALDRRPAEQAWHWEAAMRFAAARNAHVRAGLAAEVLDPGGTTLAHFQRALELVDAREAHVPPLEMPLPELLTRAAEAAFAADNPRRAASLVGQAIEERTSAAAVGAGALRDVAARHELRLELGLAYLRLGQYRWAGGDLLAAISALTEAVEVVPDDAVPERARVLGVLAQHLMLDGRFRESAALAEQARAMALAAGEAAIPELGHATCTLGVDRGYLGDLDGGLALLSEAATLARTSRRLDDLMRAYANQTHLLEMEARLEDALAAVQDGIAAARRWGAEAAYGTFLRGNAADILLKLGRWAESEAECRAALEWSPSRLSWSPLLALGAVLVESRADEETTRTVGQILLQLESVPEGQWTAAVQRTAVSYALWREDLADAMRAARRGWERVLETNDWRQAALAASTTLEACAAVSEAGRARRDVAAVAAAGALGAAVVREAERRLASRPAATGAAREPGLHVETARAHLARLRGRHDPTAWARIALAWQAIHVPYLEAKARWWEADAALRTRGDRAAARRALLEAWALAEALPARPLLRELARLARRARIGLPVELPRELPPLSALPPPLLRRIPVAVGPGRDAEGRATPAVGEDHPPSRISERLLQPEPRTRDPFNLSPREYEVLSIIVEGRMNREIAERLFISERTVGVHVRNILGKLGVGSRIEAANVAIRLGLVAVPDTVRVLPGA